MTREQIKIFNKAEQILKEGIYKYKAEGETDSVATVLAYTALKNLFNNNGLLHYDFYNEVLKDLEIIYITEPVRAYEIYKKYNICK